MADSLEDSKFTRSRGVKVFENDRVSGYRESPFSALLTGVLTGYKGAKAARQKNKQDLVNTAIQMGQMYPVRDPKDADVTAGGIPWRYRDKDAISIDDAYKQAGTTLREQKADRQADPYFSATDAAMRTVMNSMAMFDIVRKAREGDITAQEEIKKMVQMLAGMKGDLDVQTAFGQKYSGDLQNPYSPQRPGAAGSQGPNPPLTGFSTDDDPTLDDELNALGGGIVQ